MNETTENVTLCPFRRSDTLRDLPCMRSRCELWTERYTTEGIAWSGCSFRIGALTDATGHIPV
jgi:hypothetical protein